MRVIYIDIDSLRPDHLGCYGYHRNTSPVIDALAGEGVVFEQVYTSDAPCLPSRTALFSGRHGIQTGVVGHGGTASQPKIQGQGRSFRDYFGMYGLSAQLRKLGFNMNMISPFPERHSAHWVAASFHRVVDTGDGGHESAEAIMPHIHEWLTRHQANDKWFLHVNLWDPHTPYRVPPEHGERFANDPLPAWLDNQALIDRHVKMTGFHTLQDVWHESCWPRQPQSVYDRAGMRKLIDGYDMGVWYADRAIGEIVASLKKAGVYEDTMIIVSADHGENFGELGIYAEHATADDGTCHVPLIIKYPGGAAGKRDAGLHYQFDLGATLVELLGGTPPAIWDAKSLAQSVLTGAQAGRKELIIGQGAHVCQRAVRWDGADGHKLLYMRTYHDGFYASFEPEMLFDLSVDPHETANIAATRPDLCAEGRVRLARWHEEQMKQMVLTSSDLTDPMQTVMREGGPFHGGLSQGEVDVQRFLKYLDHLKATGRAG